MSVIQFKRNDSVISNKLHLDKYYTPKELAKYCIDKTYEVIGIDNITEVIEPSAGSGSFSLQIPNCIAYDIEPEHKSIIEQDFLKLDLAYKKGRCIIGNPPFGYRSLLVQKFYRHSCDMGDYVAFIVPISQLNNEHSMYQFELIHSEDLGKVTFSDNSIVHVAFNIYRRPEDGKIRMKRPNYQLDFVEIREIRQARGQYLPKDFDYDIGICAWGDIGKIVESECTYNQEMYFKIHDEKYRDKIVELIKTTNWREIYPMSKSPTLKQWQVNRHIYKTLL